MDTLIRQTRVRFYGAGNENKEESGRDRSLEPQKTQSFKGEKKKTQSWFERQFSRQISQDFDSSSEAEYAAAVAAAAFAINLLEELSTADQKRKSEGADTRLTKIKSKSEDTSTRVPEAGKISRRFSGEPSMTNLEIPDKLVPVTAGKDERIPEKAVGPAPSIKKTASFADNLFDTTAGRKTERESPKKLELPSPEQPAYQPTDMRRQSSTRPGIVETEADAWEKTEMAKIEQRYEKLNTTILDWERKKKAKAKRQKEKTESELERKRAKASQRYLSEMENIDKVAGGARAQAKENRRNEEFKAKEKAHKIRVTGKIPPTCLCF